MLFLLQVQIRNENDLVVGGHRVLDVSITKTSSEGAANFVVEGLIGTGGEGHAHFSQFGMAALV